jgi:RNA polymerase subunit RPABC4/transcription elongation factor Spt4
MDQQKSYVPEGKPFKFCSNCGAKIDKEAVICPACGVSQTGSAGFGSINNAQSSFATNTQEDRDGIGKIKNGALVSLIGIILSLVGLAAVEGTLLSGIRSGAPLSGLSSLIAIALVGVIIGLISILLYRSGFGILRQVDGRRFGTPFTFSTVFLVGFVFLILGLLIFLAAISSVDLALVVVGDVFLILSVILLLLGDIIGIVLGLWRVGERYNSTAIKVGAIFFIIPYLDVLAPILVFIGAHSAQKSMESMKPPADGTI